MYWSVLLGGAPTTTAAVESVVAGAARCLRFSFMPPSSSPSPSPAPDCSSAMLLPPLRVVDADLFDSVVVVAPPNGANKDDEDARSAAASRRSREVAPFAFVLQPFALPFPVPFSPSPQSSAVWCCLASHARVAACFSASSAAGTAVSPPPALLGRGKG